MKATDFYKSFNYHRGKMDVIRTKMRVHGVTKELEDKMMFHEKNAAYFKNIINEIERDQ